VHVYVHVCVLMNIHLIMVRRMCVTRVRECVCICVCMCVLMCVCGGVNACDLAGAIFTSVFE